MAQVLKRNNKTLGWVLSDDKCFIPSYYMHKTMMEGEFKPVTQPQHHLNPTMKEVVRKKMVKLLEVGMIYPISNNTWVSLFCIVPKKGGMIVIKSKKKKRTNSNKNYHWMENVYRLLET